MIQKIVFISIFCLLSSPLISQFERYYGDEVSKDEAFVSAALTADGGICHFGYSHTNSQGASDFYLVKTDAQGQQIWQKQWDYYGTEVPMKMLALANGNLFVTGYSYEKMTSKNYGYYAMLDATGNVLWQSTANSQTDIAWKDALLASDGNICLLGNYKNNAADEMQVAKLNLNGTFQFNQNYSPKTAYSFLEANNGNLMVGGIDAGAYSIFELSSNGNLINTYPADAQPDFIFKQANYYYISSIYGDVAKYDNGFNLLWLNGATSNKMLAITDDGHLLMSYYNTLYKVDSLDGNTLWQNNPTGAAQNFDYQSAVLLSPTQWVLSGNTSEFLGKDGLMDLVNPQDGNSINHFSFGTQGIEANEYGNTFCPTPDGGFILAGENTLSGNIFAFSTSRIFKTDAQGNMEWTTDIGDPNKDLGTWGICNANNGGYVVMGYYSDSSTSETGIFTAQVNTQGVLQWTKYYNTGQVGIFGGIKPYPAGGYIVVGTALSSTNQTNATAILRLDANGDTLWTRRFRFSNSNNPYDFCITNIGNIVIAGRRRSCDANNQCGNRQWMMKTDQSGNLLWEKIYLSTVFELSRFTSLEENLTNGDLYAYGYTIDVNTGIEHARLIRTNAQGDSLSQYVVQGNLASPIRGYKARICSNNDVVLFNLRTLNNNIQARQANLIRLDNNYNVAWDNYYTTQEAALLYEGSVLNDGSIVGVGSAQRNNNYDFYLLKTDANGIVSSFEIQELPFAATVFPNPSNKGYIEISLKEELGETYQVNLYNSIGQTVLSVPFHDLIQHRISVKDFPAGIYSVQIVDSKGKALTKKVSLL